MSAGIPSYSASSSDLIRRLAIAGLLTGVIDGLFSSILSVAFYNSTVSRLFQGVASVLLGSDAVNGGNKTAAIGVLMHFGVAFLWSGIFLFLILRWRWVRRVLATRYGVAEIACLYGPLIWTVMSLALIPALTHRPPAITVRWWIQFFGHIPFVGLPIVAVSRRR
jgi:MFS-type transporter involved in bile tolerance (Atg22 family)